MEKIRLRQIQDRFIFKKGVVVEVGSGATRPDLSKPSPTWALLGPLPLPPLVPFRPFWSFPFWVLLGFLGLLGPYGVPGFPGGLVGLWARMGSFFLARWGPVLVSTLLFSMNLGGPGAIVYKLGIQADPAMTQFTCPSDMFLLLPWWLLG